LNIEKQIDNLFKGALKNNSIFNNLIAGDESKLIKLLMKNESCPTE